MVGAEKRYTEHDYVQITITNTDERGLVQNVAFQLNIKNTKLTDAEDAGLKRILREAAEKANDLLGW